MALTAAQAHPGRGWRRRPSRRRSGRRRRRRSLGLGGRRRRAPVGVEEAHQQGLDGHPEKESWALAGTPKPFFKIPQIPSDRDYRALNRGTAWGRLGAGVRGLGFARVLLDLRTKPRSDMQGCWQVLVEPTSTPNKDEIRPSSRLSGAYLGGDFMAGDSIGLHKILGLPSPASNRGFSALPPP